MLLLSAITPTGAIQEFKSWLFVKHVTSQKNLLILISAEAPLVHSRFKIKARPEVTPLRLGHRLKAEIHGP